MTRRGEHWAARHAGWVLAVLCVALSLSMLHLWLMLQPLEPGIVSLQLTVSATRFWAVLAQWGPEGVALYRQHFAFDHLHALLYAAWGALVTARVALFDGLAARLRWLLAALLPAAAVLDLLENGSHLHLLDLLTDQAPAGADGWVVAAGCFSLVKWLLIAAYFAFLGRRAFQVLGRPVAQALELRIPPLALGLFIAGSMGAAAWIQPGAPVPVPGWVPLGLGLSGCALALAGLQSFRRHGTTVNPTLPQATRTMVTNGIYRYSRNPMYLGMALVLLAWGVYLGHWQAVLGVPAFMAYLQRFQIVPEERALHAQFGPAYRLYSARVRRWL